MFEMCILIQINFLIDLLAFSYYFIDAVYMSEHWLLLFL